MRYLKFPSTWLFGLIGLLATVLLRKQDVSAGALEDVGVYVFSFVVFLLAGCTWQSIRQASANDDPGPYVVDAYARSDDGFEFLVGTWRGFANSDTDAADQATIELDNTSVSICRAAVRDRPADLEGKLTITDCLLYGSHNAASDNGEGNCLYCTESL